MEQLSLFQIVDEVRKPKFLVLERVMVRLIDEESDSETHHYRKYYEPHIVNKVGEVLQIIVTIQSITYEVDIYGTKYYLLEEELVGL
ncbi:hypothetical protein [Solibacillus daqui]|uniref:hypothetical protein n=1 Tax=Solibacillus daqui TaxID=2912187 RepID=UPI00236662A6|nr:hypothetical protein [Solibacillus daqui]